MLTLILNTINDSQNYTILVCSLPLPIIYFTTPLESTLTKDLTQSLENENTYNSNQGLVYNISKGIEAYEEWSTDKLYKELVFNNDNNIKPESAFEMYQKMERELALEEMLDEIEYQTLNSPDKSSDNSSYSNQERLELSKLIDNLCNKELNKPKVNKSKSKQQSKKRISNVNKGKNKKNSNNT